MYEILSPALSKIGEPELVISDNHSIYWQEPGSMTLIAAATPGNEALLKNDNFIYVPDGGRGDQIYLIVNVSLDEQRQEITVNGKTADYLLHQRAAGDQVFTGTTAGAALRGLINGNLRGLPVTAAVEDWMDDPAVVRYPLDGGALDEMAKTMMQYCGIGRRVQLGGGTVQLTFSGGVDKTGRASVPVLGIQSGRGRSPTLAIDASDYANVAVGILTYKSGTEAALETGATSATGSQRREFWVGEMLQEDGESDGEFRSRAEENAAGMLADHILRTTISADIRPEDYGTDYQVGDIIRVRVGSTEISKQITSATWLRDQNNDKVTLQLGEPLNTVIAEIKEKKPTASSGGLGGVRSATKAQEKKIAGLETDYKSLLAKVTDVVAGMDAYVLNNTFEDYKLAVARLFAAIQEQDNQIIAELALKVSNKDLKDELVNYALASSLDDYLTVRAAAEMYVTDGDVTAAIGAYVVTDANGNKSTLAAILADVIKLQGDTEVVGNLTVSDGRLRVSKGIIANGNSNIWGDLAVSGKLFVNSNNFYVGGELYKPTEITSKSGVKYTVLGA